MNRRFLFLSLAIALGYSFLFFRLYNIQVSKNGYYVAKAEMQYAASGLVAAKRGTIYFADKNGTKLAVAVENDSPVVYAVPKLVDDAKEAYNRLLEVIKGLPLSVETSLANKNSSYVLLERKADQSVVDRITAENIKGVVVDDVPERYYPFGSLAAHVLGFVGPNSSDNGESGKYGVEKFYEDFLSGVPGKTENGKLVQPQDGQDLVLTIDQNIQKKAETILSDLEKITQAKSGVFIVEEPSTGKILAMGGYPNFDPNNYSDANVADFINPAIQKIYEPGSVVKVMTMAAGIDTGKITPHTTYLDKGTVVINGMRIDNHDYKTHGAYGVIDMTKVLENSLNLGAIFAESQTGNNVFRNYLVKFGINSKTGIDLPGEIAGDLRPLFGSYVPQVNFADASFGQGIAMTPLELINAVSVIANGGEMMRPYINSALGPKSLGTVISSSTARQVTGMMVSAVDSVKINNIAGYSIAGKTGTSNIPDPKTGGYSQKVDNTYVGFGPASNPRFIALIKLEDPVGAPIAATTVMPAFRDLAQFILNYYNIPPDRL
ncbi:MAG TPA: penicillin-binding protein 2 [Candidatus Paceibacterota bacterium]|nr:penicillin-binding protein 2 [Candidatus Paceibacterota bacterium]